MRKLKYIIWAGIFALFSTSVYSSDLHKEHHEHDEHSEHSDHHEHDQHKEGAADGKAIGEGKAIQEFIEGKGFSLSKEAYQALEIRLIKPKDAVFNIAPLALVNIHSEVGIYRFRDGLFKLVPLEILERSARGVRARVKEFQNGDSFVESDPALLRVTDVYSVDESEYGHSH